MPASSHKSYIVPHLQLFPFSFLSKPHIQRDWLQLKAPPAFTFKFLNEPKPRLPITPCPVTFLAETEWNFSLKKRSLCMYCTMFSRQHFPNYPGGPRRRQNGLRQESQQEIGRCTGCNNKPFETRREMSKCGCISRCLFAPCFIFFSILNMRQR